MSNLPVSDVRLSKGLPATPAAPSLPVVKDVLGRPVGVWTGKVCK